MGFWRNGRGRAFDAIIVIIAGPALLCSPSSFSPAFLLCCCDGWITRASRSFVSLLRDKTYDVPHLSGVRITELTGGRPKISIPFLRR